MRETQRGRGRVGLLVPFTNSNLEPDMAALLPPGVTLHATRLGGYDAGAVPDSGQMAGLGAAGLDGPLGLVLGVRPDVVLYGCTSATLAHGLAFDRALAGRARAAAGVPVVTAAGAVLAALAALGARRVAFASPYVEELADRAVAFLAEAGVETVSRAGPAAALDNAGQGALTPAQVAALALRADSPGAEAIVLSCTDMRAAEAVARIEAAAGKPVVASNPALAVAAARALGIDPAETRCGRLSAARALA